MALLGTVIKQPREVIDFDINYSSALSGRTDTIVQAPSVEVSPQEAGGVVVSYVIVEPPLIKLIVSGGLDTTGLYKITILASTLPSGLIFESEVNVLVEEV